MSEVILSATETVKPRKRQSSKAIKMEGVKPTKLSLYVTPGAAQRLKIHAAMTGSDMSALVESLINDGLRRFVVSDRAKVDACVTGVESVN